MLSPEGHEFARKRSPFDVIIYYNYSLSMMICFEIMVFINVGHAANWASNGCPLNDITPHTFMNTCLQKDSLQ